MRAVRFVFVGILLAIALGCADTATQPAPSPAPRASPPPPAPAATAATERPPAAPSPEPTPAGSPLGGSRAERELWARLRRADAHYFVLIRHALAPGTGDPPNFQLDDCTTQRNLSATGRAQAERLGAALKQRNIPVARVLSSQWCRCLETAELMAVGDVEPFPALNSFFRDRSTRAAQTTAVREFMQAQSDEPGVTVMVTHFVNIAALSDRQIESGALVVMTGSAAGEPVVVGQLAAF